MIYYQDIHTLHTLPDMSSCTFTYTYIWILTWIVAKDWWWLDNLFSLSYWFYDWFRWNPCRIYSWVPSCVFSHRWLWGSFWQRNSTYPVTRPNAFVVLIPCKSEPSTRLRYSWRYTNCEDTISLPIRFLMPRPDSLFSAIWSCNESTYCSDSNSWICY